MTDVNLSDRVMNDVISENYGVKEDVVTKILKEELCFCHVA
jgi:energy-converting hydrogenase A subunit M